MKNENEQKLNKCFQLPFMKRVFITLLSQVRNKDYRSGMYTLDDAIYDTKYIYEKVIVEEK